MKKAFAVILLLALVLVGCANQNHANPPGTEAVQINPDPTFSTEATEVTKMLDDTETEDNSLPAETEATTGKEQSTESAETVEKPANPSTTVPNTTNPKPNEDKPKEDPPKENGTVPTTPAPTEPVQPGQTETVPTEPEATEPETEATEPPTNPTEPPTEPTGCTHEWKCIHHAEEGHWRAGIEYTMVQVQTPTQ